MFIFQLISMLLLTYCSLSHASLPIPFKENLEILQAAPEDAEEITALIKLAYKRDCFRNGDARSRISLEQVRKHFTNPEYTWYAIKDLESCKIICVGLYDQTPESSVQGNIHLLSAHPDVWGMKLSKYLLDAMENQSRQNQQSKIRLRVVNTSPGLIKYYEQSGYCLTGDEFQIPEEYISSEWRGKDQNGKLKVFTLLMEKDLKKNI